MSSKHTISTDLLILEAQTILMGSNDPLHDHRHSARVARYAQQIAGRMYIQNACSLEALKISAWWHDVSRVMTKRASFVIMPFFDDTLSAFFLFRAALSHGLLNRTTWLAIRLILGKSFGTGKIFARLFLTKRMRRLLDILNDADTVDTLASERTQDIHELVESSRVYHYAYRMLVWWVMSSAFLEVKTQEAKEYLATVLSDFVTWMNQDHIRAWHIERYGSIWVERLTERVYEIMRELEQDIGVQFVTI